MMRRVLLASVLCASAQLPAQARNIDVRLRGYEQLVRLDTLAAWTIVSAQPGMVHAAAREVLTALKMPLTTIDSTGGVLYHKGLNTRERLLGHRMSWALKCGDGMIGENADTYRIHMAYAVFLEPAADNQTRMGIALAAGANNIEGAYKPAVGCGTTGAFENEMAMLIKAKAQLK